MNDIPKFKYVSPWLLGRCEIEIRGRRVTGVHVERARFYRALLNGRVLAEGHRSWRACVRAADKYLANQPAGNAKPRAAEA
jgi:hypothetical protein